KTPMVVIYEAQYASHLFAGDGVIRPDMRLIYPSPTVLSKHTLVPFTDKAGEVGRLLQEGSEFARLEHRSGSPPGAPKFSGPPSAGLRAPSPAAWSTSSSRPPMTIWRVSSPRSRSATPPA